MKNLLRIIAGLLLIANAVCIEPYCAELRQQPLTRMLTAEETYRLDIPKYFKGANLRYSLSEEVEGVEFEQRIKNTNSSTFPEPIKGIEITHLGIVDVGIRLSSNGIQWEQTGSILSEDEEEGYQYRFLKLFNNGTMEIGDTRNLLPEPAENLTCYSMSILGQGVAMVECQTISQTTVIDKFYFLENEAEAEVIEYEFESPLGSSADRKTAVLVMGEDTYLLTAVKPEESSGLVNQSYINIYHLDEEQSYKPSLVLTLDAASFNAKQLIVEDIAIDSNSNIYIVDQQVGVRTFQYLKSNRIVRGPSYQFAGTYHKLSVLLQDTNKTIVLLGAEGEIKELEYKGKTLTLVRKYELPEDFEWDESAELALNSHYFTLKTQSLTYVYELGTVSLNELFVTLPVKADTFLWFSQIQDIMITVNQEAAQVYALQRGALLINEIAASEQVTIIATSMGDQNITCSMNLILKKIQNTESIYPTGTLPSTMRVPAPIILTFKIEEIISGGQLQYTFEDSPGVTGDVNLKTEVTLSGEKKGVSDIFFPIDKYISLRVSRSTPTASLSLQICSIIGVETVNRIDCQQRMALGVFTDISQQTMYRFRENETSILTMFAYVTKKSPNTLQVANVPLAATEEPSTVSVSTLTFSSSIGNLYSNGEWLFVTLPQDHIIHMVKYNKATDKLIMVNNITRLNFTDSVKSFYPKSLLGFRGDILLIKNINSLIFWRLSGNQQPVALSEILIPGMDDKVYDWNFALTQSGDMVLVRNITDIIVEHYSLEDLSKLRLLKTIDLMGHQLIDLELMQTGTNMVAVKTTKGLNSHLTILRPGSEAVNCNYQAIAMNQKTLMGFVPFGESLLIETASSSNELYAELYYGEPLLSAMVTVGGDKLASNALFKVNASNNFTSVSLNSSLRVLNHDTSIRPTSSRNDKINLPKQAQDLEKVLDVRNLFNGPIVDLEVECPMCDGQQIIVTDFFEEVEADVLTEANRYIFFKDESLIWTLCDTGIYIRNTQGKLICDIDLNVEDGSECYNWQQYNDTMLILYCSFPDEKDYFLTVGMQADKQNGKVVGLPQLIPDEYQAAYSLTMKISGRRLFVLDNDLEGEGQGTILVFTIEPNGEGLTMKGERLITASSFTTDRDQIIQDIEIMSTTMLDEQSKQILMLTLSEFKLVYCLYDPTIQEFVFESQHVVDLEKQELFPDYSVDRNELMQIEVLGCVSYTNGTGSTVLISMVLTTAYAEHLKVELQVYLSQQTAVVGQSITLKQVLRGYGYSDVLNWASSSDSQLIVAYRSDESVTFGWYNLTKASNGLELEPQWFTGGVTEADTDQNPDIFGLLFLVQNQLMFAHNVDPDGDLLYTLSSTVSLIMNYSKPGNFTQIQLQASNEESDAVQMLDIEFRQPPPTDDSIKWYVVVIIVCGSLIALLLGANIIHRYYRQRKLKKETLLESETEDMASQV